MPSHPLDFQLQANLYSTPELLAIFDEQQKMDRWLQVEAALARAQADLGIIPEAAADVIGTKAELARLDPDLIRQEYTRSRNSLIPVLKALRQACGREAGQYVHYGATTQDILDTGLVLELKEALQVIYRDFRGVEELLIDLSRKYSLTPMIGRTHGQQALPITFGLKTVGWAIEVRRHIERLQGLYPRIMIGQLSGAVGTMAALGPKGREVARRAMALLDLEWKPPGWHTCRDNIAETASCCAIIIGTLEKIANEIFLLGKTEVGELAEPAPQGPMSSTMPHKQNPVFCQRIAVLARQVRSLAGCVVESMIPEHERDPRLLWSEWLAMPQLCMYTGTAADYLLRVLAGLVVHEENMKKNLYLHKDAIMSEWLLFRLATHLGRIEAQDKVHDLLRRAAAEHSSLRQVLAADENISPLLTDEDMDFLDQPERNIGLAGELVEDTLADIAARRQKDPEVLCR